FVMITTGPSGTPNPVASGGAVNVSVTPVDSLGRTLSSGWTALCGGLGSNGSFDNAALQAPTWPAAANPAGGPQRCVIQATVSDGQEATQSAMYTQIVNSAAAAAGGGCSSPGGDPGLLPLALLAAAGLCRRLRSPWKCSLALWSPRPSLLETRSFQPSRASPI